MRAVLDHIALNVRDMNTMLSFYTDVLELQPERLDEYRQGKAPFPSLRLNDNTIIDLFARDPATDEGSLNHFCLTLDKTDWDALRERLDAAGVTLDGEPGSRWGARGDATAISFPDPEGNTIEARYYP